MTEQPTPEAAAAWETAVDETRALHPDWSDETIAGALAYAVMTPENQQVIADIAAAHAIDVVGWTAMIHEVMARWPEWTEQEANDACIAFLTGHLVNPEG